MVLHTEEKAENSSDMWAQINLDTMYALIIPETCVCVFTFAGTG